MERQTKEKRRKSYTGASRKILPPFNPHTFYPQPKF
jgi:hypothetical protein